MDRLFVIGLGNPGSEYAYTRHNVGWLFLDYVAYREEIKFKPGRGDFYIGEGERFVLVKPTTFMNLSGIAVKQVVEQYEINNLESLLVVLDDADLPFGRLRLRLKGSAGSHNGLASVIMELGTEEVPRLRIGIGRPEGMRLRDYVLSEFTDEEIEVLRTEVFPVGYEGIKIYVEESPMKAINFINSKKINREV